MFKISLFILSIWIISPISYAQKTGDKKLFKIADGVNINMVWVEPGIFWMGSPDDEPERYLEREVLHEVKITKGYWIAQTETTQKVW